MERINNKELNSHDLARELEIVKLQEENEILKENAENNNKVVDKVNWENMLLKKENQELKSQLRGTTHCYDEEEHNRLKEEITNLSKDVDMWNAKYNDMFDENKKLQNRIDEVTKICLARQKYISDCETKIVILGNQQKEFIKYLKDKMHFYKINTQGYSMDLVEEILNKYKEIIGDDK